MFVDDDKLSPLTSIVLRAPPLPILGEGVGGWGLSSASDAGDNLKENLKPFSVLILSGLIDVGFVLLWVITQLLVLGFVVRTPLVSWLSIWMVLAFQFVFAISTLVPVALYLVRDFTIGIRKWAEIQEGIEQS